MGSLSRIQSDLIDANGIPQFGVLNQPIARVNYLDYDLRTPMDRKRGRLARHLGFNQFQFIGISSPEFIAGIALVDLKWVGNAFAYVFDLETRRLTTFTSTAPVAFGMTLPNTPDEGASTFNLGRNRIAFEAHSATRARDLRVALPGKIQLHAHFREPRGFKPLRVCSRAGYNGWVFTQKAAGLPIQGSLTTPLRSYDLDERCRVSYDWSCGYMRRETAWNWASISAVLADGRDIGLNLAAGVNETGVTENVLWIGQRQHKLEMAVFEYDRYDTDSPWRVRTTDGRVDLHFQPLGCRKEKIDVVLLASNFRQYFGYYSGHVVDESGQKIKVEKLPGFAEDHYAKW